MKMFAIFELAPSRDYMVDTTDYLRNFNAQSG